MPTFTDIGGAVARLRIVDDFTAPLQRAIEQLTEFQASLDRVREAGVGLSRPFSRIGTAVAKANAPLRDFADGVARSAGEARIARDLLGGMAAPIAEATTRATELGAAVSRAADPLLDLEDTLTVDRARMTAMARSSAAIAASAARAEVSYRAIGGVAERFAPLGRAPSGGGDGRGGGAEAAAGGFFAGRRSGNIADRALSIPGLAVGISIGDAMKQALDENLAITQTLSAFNLRTTGAQAEGRAAALREIVRNAAMGTIFTQRETANALLRGAQMSGVFGANAIQRFATVFPVLLRTAEVAQMQGLGSIGENLRASMGFAHLELKYDPRVLAGALNEVLAIAEHTRTPIAQVESAMKYSLPMALATGANVNQAALITGFLERAGMGRTAGYSVGQALFGVLNTGGALNAQLVSARSRLGHELGRRTPHFHMTAHMEALHAFGLVNAAGGLTVLNAQGGLDIQKMLADVERFASTHTAQVVATALHNAFGTRGARGMALLIREQAQLSQFEQLIRGTPTAVAQQAAFARTPLQEFEQFGARLMDLGNILATGLLPELTAFLGVLDKIFGALDRWLARHHATSHVLGAAGVGAAIGAAVGEVLTVVRTPEGADTPHHMAGRVLANAALMGRRPTITQARAPQVTVTVHAPFTVHGDILDEGAFRALLGDWWAVTRPHITQSVTRAIRQEQHQAERGSMIDRSNTEVQVGEHGFAFR